MVVPRRPRARDRRPPLRRDRPQHGRATNRLRRLEAAGVLEKRLYQERPPRFEYRLTEAGDELRPILLSLAQWGAKWADPPRITVWEHDCGAELELEHTCASCGGQVTGRDVRIKRYDPVPTAAA